MSTQNKTQNIYNHTEGPKFFRVGPTWAKFSEIYDYVEFESKLEATIKIIFKVFSFACVNYYAPLFYIAFFKNLEIGTPNSYRAVPRNNGRKIGWVGCDQSGKIIEILLTVHWEYTVHWPFFHFKHRVSLNHSTLWYFQTVFTFRANKSSHGFIPSVDHHVLHF